MENIVLELVLAAIQLCSGLVAGASLNDLGPTRYFTSERDLNVYLRARQTTAPWRPLVRIILGLSAWLIPAIYAWQEWNMLTGIRLLVVYYATNHSGFLIVDLMKTTLPAAVRRSHLNRVVKSVSFAVAAMVLALVITDMLS